MINVVLFQFKVHRSSVFFVLFFFSFSFLSPKHRRALNFRLDILIKKGKVGVWFINYIFDAKCLQVYFTVSQNNFIFGDVISMWEMSFVFKNGWTYVLDH